jgi:hypothetical protein
LNIYELVNVDANLINRMREVKSMQFNLKNALFFNLFFSILVSTSILVFGEY